jgi:hypothetical protein
MKSTNRVTDEYRRRARLQPMLLVLLPPCFVIGMLVPEGLGTWGILTRLGAAAVASLASAVGFTTLLEQLGRDQGKIKEPGLWASWGGAPTTQMLRHRERNLCNPALRARYHRKLQQLVPDLRLPSAADETACPAAADQIYDAYVRYLIAQTRDREKFPLVLEENINYGFRRNLWGMRPVGIVLSAVASAMSAYFLYLGLKFADPLWIAWAAVLIGSVCLLTWWLFRIRRAWVFIPAKAYAQRLLEACDVL